MRFETIHDHSENANENDNGDRGKQARQFCHQGFSPNFWFGCFRNRIAKTENNVQG